MVTEEDIVYKYRSFTNIHHKRIITDNELYLSSPQDFNDPYDCRIVPDLTLLDSKTKIQNYTNKLIVQSYDKIEKSGLDIKTLMDGFDQRLIENLNEENKEYQELFYERQNLCYGILCLTFKWNSILMWSHYADCHRGFCVGFHKGKLEDSGFFGKGGPVNYEDQLPKIDPLEDDLMRTGFVETHTKAKDWEYEQEYRLFVTNGGELKQSQRIVVVPDEFYAELILGMNFPKDEVSIMRKIATEKGIKLYQAKKSPDMFELLRSEL